MHKLKFGISSVLLAGVLGGAIVFLRPYATFLFNPGDREAEDLKARAEDAIHQADVVISRIENPNPPREAEVSDAIHKQVQNADQTASKLQSISAEIQHARQKLRQTHAASEELRNRRKSLTDQHGKPQIRNSEEQERLEDLLEDERELATRRQNIVKNLEKKLLPLTGH
ncbi:MAG TPA: hypothetical protein VE954_32535 [Oligoflexus sp.]|uniref:hypothetical protein n=1 Tax=Oligoflexus sp. TaxID=1971216 RepID=UPI002D715593|nr:hypothetical protein [Oligoflexus sp.]HYX37856.1 hypothetical protein [Oligoflexus sp.]